MVKRLFLVLLVVCCVAGCGKAEKAKSGPSYLEAVQLYKAEKDLLADAEKELAEQKKSHDELNDLVFKAKTNPGISLSDEQRTKFEVGLEESRGLITWKEQKVKEHEEKVLRAKQIMDEAEKSR